MNDMEDADEIMDLIIVDPKVEEVETKIFEELILKCQALDHQPDLKLGLEMMGGSARNLKTMREHYKNMSLVYHDGC